MWSFLPERDVSDLNLHCLAGVVSLHVDTGLEVPVTDRGKTSVLSVELKVVVDVDLDSVGVGVVNDVVLELGVVDARGKNFSSVVL